MSEHRGSTSKFTHGDALGSTRGITDSTQAVTDSVLYDAFGNTVTRTGSTPTPFGFVGKAQYQSDSDSGLQLLGHRYYDPSIGRFLSQDPIQDGNNWYAYCENNPLTGVDPDGLKLQIIGFDPANTNKIKDAIDKIRATSGKIPKQIIDIIDGKDKDRMWPDLIIRPTLTPNPHPELGDTYTEPIMGGASTINLTLPIVTTMPVGENGTGKPVKPQLDVIIAHEVGHLLATASGKSADENYIIDTYENPYEKAAHLPVRTHPKPKPTKPKPK